MFLRTVAGQKLPLSGSLPPWPGQLALRDGPWLQSLVASQPVLIFAQH